jgi:hypothetical protein
LVSQIAANADVDVVELYRGTRSTDFWGISFALSSIDVRSMSRKGLDRELSLMQACWTFFDEVRTHVSTEMLKGVRGGGRDRDHTVRHVRDVEQDWAKKVRVDTPKDVVVIDDEGIGAYRGAYCTAIRTFHSEARMART